MATLLSTTQIVLPLFILMVAGFVIRRLGLLSDETCREMNGLVYRFFLPAFILLSLMKSDPSSIDKPGIFLFIACGYLALFALLFIAVPRIEQDPKKRGVMIQAISRSNYSLFGIPLVGSMFPGADLSLVSLLIVVVIPLTNTLCTIALEINRGEMPSAKSLIRSVIKNPLIVSALAGLALLYLAPPMPTIVATSLSEIGKIASPLALILLGASIDLNRAAGHKRQLLIVLIAKNVLSPLFLLTAAVLMGFRGLELACVLIAFAAPTAVNSYAMAASLGGDGDLAAECIVFSTALSVFTIFCFVYALKLLHFI